MLAWPITPRSTSSLTALADSWRSMATVPRLTVSPALLGGGLRLRYLTAALRRGREIAGVVLNDNS
jgi:hypothetical protein